MEQLEQKYPHSKIEVWFFDHALRAEVKSQKAKVKSNFQPEVGGRKCRGFLSVRFLERVAHGEAVALGGEVLAVRGFPPLSKVLHP